MTWLTLALLLTLGSGSADAFVAKKEGDRVILHDPSCPSLRKDLHTLAEWTRSAGEKKSCDEQGAFHQTNEGDCWIDATECLPDHVVKFQGVNPKFAGPNCWNLSLVMKDILPSLRYATPDEMAFYMASPLCHALAPGEARHPGDVGAIREMTAQGPAESHGFIYVSEELAYSKNGYAKENPYALQSMEGVMETYEVPKLDACRQNQLPKDNSTCKNAVSYYHCDSMDSYLAKNPNAPEAIVSALRTEGSAEGCLQSRALDGTPVNAKLQDVIEDSTRALVAYLDKEKAKAKGTQESDQEKFLLGSLQLRLDALGQQLADSEDDSMAAEMNDLARALKASAAELGPPNRK